MKRIAILPIFNEGHFIPHLIENCVNVLGVTHVVLNDGMFPCGPEYSSGYSKEYLDEYTTDGRWSFDFDSIKLICKILSSEYNIEISLNKMDYPPRLPSKHCFYMGYTSNLPIMDKDDVIFPMEADLFFRDDDKENIENSLKRLNYDEGFGVLVYRFFESPKIIMNDFMPVRKVVARWGTGAFYTRLVSNIFDGDRDFALRYESSFYGYHYEWIRPGKYFMARVKQLIRPAGFWERVISNRDFIMKNHSIPTDSFVQMLDYTGVHASALYKHCKWEEYYG